MLGRKKNLYRDREYYRNKQSKKSSRTFQFPRKVFLYIVIILCLAAGGNIIFGNLHEKENDSYLKLSSVWKMVSFAELDEAKFYEKLEKDKSDTLTYKDAAYILEMLSLQKTINYSPDSAKEEQKIPKADWLTIYDEITGMLDEKHVIAFERLYILGDHKVADGLKKDQVLTNNGLYTFSDITLSSYAGKVVDVISKEKEILCVKDKSDGLVTISNIWVTKSTEKGFEIFADGYYFNFEGEILVEDIGEVLADIEIEKNEIKSVKTKEENINGKILSIKDEGIEIEGYGLVEFAEGFRLYKVYDELEQINKDDLSLGYEQTEFIVADGKICGGLVVKPASSENIRVLVKDDNYKDIYHSKVTFTPSADFTLAYGKKEKSFKKGETVTIKETSKYFKEDRNRVIITPSELTAKTKVDSVSRSCGTPSYRGVLEIVKTKKGLVLVNEVGIEDYLYSVIPSEMPTSYDLEALKAQAVCARSYAYKHIEDNAYAEYGAHVDDSTAYQVYQNYNEDEQSVKAVNDTAGEIMVNDGEIINAYYFSTSSGHTTSDSVWGTKKSSAYLEGTYVGAKKGKDDLTDEKKFKSFIKSTDYKAYEKEETWYRWKVTLTKKQLGNTINNNIGKLNKSKPDCVLVKNKKGKYKKGSVASIGTLKSIKVNKRGEGGVVEELIIKGKEAEVKITNENVIRTLLGIGDIQIKRNDGSKAAGGSLFPSAYFAVEKKEKDGEVKFTFYGGGLGHGIGMSQNGAKAMAEAGKDYKDILNFFYSDIEIKGK